MPYDGVRNYLIAALIGAAAIAGAVTWINVDRKQHIAEGRRLERLEAEAAAAKLLAQRRAEDAATQQEVEANYANYRAEILARDRDLSSLDDRVTGLRAEIAAYRNRQWPPVSTTSAGTDGTAGPDWIGVFAECLWQYQQVAKDAASDADRLKGLQDYVNSLPHMKPKK